MQHSLLIKLTPNNYLTWKAQFLTLLNNHKLDAFIDGTVITVPPTITSPNDALRTITNPAYVKWFQKDQLVLSWIY